MQRLEKFICKFIGIKTIEVSVMTKQNSWLLTKKEAEEILQNILDNKSIYLFKQNDNFYYAYRNKRIFL